MAWQDKCNVLGYVGDFEFKTTDSRDVYCRYIGDGYKPVILPKGVYVTNMSFMFHECKAKSLDLSKLDTSYVTDMTGMFSNCHTTSIDLSNFNTSNVTNMRYMFCECEAASLDLSSFNTSNVTDMHDMFYMCQATSIDLSNFNTSNVTNMHKMFYNCKANVAIKNKHTKLIKQLKRYRCEYITIQ